MKPDRSSGSLLAALLVFGSSALAQAPDPAQRLPRTAPRAVQSRLPLQMTPALTPGPGAVVVERDNCGTQWTDWVTDPEADVNPCPSMCERGERQVLNSRKDGDTELYQARYQCYLPALAIDQPTGIVGTLLANGSPRTNCGTFWTSALSSPDTSVNPCPANCDRGELQVVRRSGVGSESLRYEMRYQCYIAEAARTATAQSGLAADAARGAGLDSSIAPIASAAPAETRSAPLSIPAGVSGRLPSGDLAVGGSGSSQRVFALAGLVASGTSLPLPSHNFVLAGFTASGNASTLPPHVFVLPGFTAVGPSTVAVPLNFSLAGFSASGNALALPTYRFDLRGWTSASPSTTP
jgi:hypothetical protein